MNKEFEPYWREFAENNPPSAFILGLTDWILHSDKPLDVNRNKLVSYLITYAYGSNIDKKEFLSRIQKVRQGMENFITSLNDALDGVIKYGDALYKMKKEVEEDIANLPEYAMDLDHPAVKDFIRQLDKQSYNFSEAAKLLVITRQTLRRWVDDGNFGGIPTVPEGKREHLSKEAIANLFRAMYEDKHGIWLPF